METRVLIVEDEVITGLDLRESLAGLGYQVVGIAHTCETAVELARMEKPDLVLMDIMLKGDGDGIDAAGKIRERWGIPVIFLTAYSDQDTLRRVHVTVPWGYLIKPYNERELHVTIQMALYHSERERERMVLMHRLECQVNELRGQERLMRAQMQVESVEEAARIVLEVAAGVLRCEWGELNLSEGAGGLSCRTSYGAVAKEMRIDADGMLAEEGGSGVVRSGDELAVPPCYQEARLGVMRLGGVPDADAEETQKTLERLALEGGLVLDAALVRMTLDLTDAELSGAELESILGGGENES